MFSSPRYAALLAAALFLVALLPRLWAVGRVVTPDEPAWVFRSIQFRQALLERRWADTLVTGHPGVTTTWLGALGISVQLGLHPADGTDYDWLTHLSRYSPDLIEAFPRLASFLTVGRVAVAIATSLGVVAIYALARPLFGRPAALLAGFLLALDPFVAGLSGLLHLDGLTATFATLSVLSLVTACRRDGRHSLLYLAAAGCLAALSVLTKSVGLLLIPFSGLVLLLFRSGSAGRVDGLRKVVLHGGIWALAFLVVTMAVFPAFWKQPAHVVSVVTTAANQEAEEMLRPTFFLGRVALNPGPAFYPVALLYRLSPLVLIGLVLAVRLLWRRDDLLRSMPALVLLFWTLLFLGAMSLVPKKFDRYALPAFPPLGLLAAAAWSQTISGEPAGQNTGSAHQDPHPPAGWLSLLVGVQALLLLAVVPYPLTAYSPLAGGASAARKVLPIGWGEGISAAGRWLAAVVGASGDTATATSPTVLASIFPGRTLPFDDRYLPHADYLVLDAYGRQIDPAGFDRLAAGAERVHTVRLNGVDHAWVFRQHQVEPLPSEVAALPEVLSFDNRVQLLGASASATNQQAYLAVRWALQQPGGRYTVQLVLRDDWGHAWGSLEAPLLNQVAFFPEHWEAGEAPQVEYAIALPPGIPPADYSFELALFDAGSGARLPLLDSRGGFRGVLYTHPRVAVPAPAEPISLSNLPLSVAVDAEWMDGALALLGYQPPARVPAGDSADVRLFWLPHTVLPDGLVLHLDLGDDVRLTVPLCRLPSGQWKPGFLVQEQYTLPIPPELPAGRYLLRITPAEASGVPLSGSPVSLGELEVAATDRLFALPGHIPVLLDYRLGSQILLRGLALSTPTVGPGDSVRLALYWQAEAQPDEVYTAFVHLVAPDGSIPAQADRWPAGSPSSTWAAGQVIVDEYVIPLPAGAPPGAYRIAVGLYRAADGTRLPITGVDGSSADSLFLPVSLIVSAADG